MTASGPESKSAGRRESAETVANHPKLASTKREVHVLLTGTPEFCDFFPCVIECCPFEDGRADDRFVTKCGWQFHGCVQFGKLAATLQNHKCDVALVQLHRSPSPESQFFERREILHRVQSWGREEYLCWNGFELCHYLHSVHGIPVIMVSDTGGDEALEKATAAELGARALFPWIGMSPPKLGEMLSAILRSLDC